MQGLTPDQIKALMERKAKKPVRAPSTRKRVSGTKTSKGVITPQDRSILAWFALDHKLITVGNEMPMCDNPACVDPRDKSRGQVVTMLPGVTPDTYACRFCFLAGWQVPAVETATTLELPIGNPDQTNQVPAQGLGDNTNAE